MATYTDPQFPTLANVLRRLQPNGGVETRIAEVLNQKSEWLNDIPWVQGNLETGMRMTSRTAIPSPSWRRLNAGVDPMKSHTAQFDETCGMLEGFSKVDVDLAALSGNPAAYRMTEDKAIIEGFTQEVARAIFYESAATNAERIHGLSPRYAATTGYTASSYVYKPGTNSGSNCYSIWLINWSPETIFGFFPKHSKAGLSQKDLGVQLTKDAANKEFLAHVSHYKWDLGLGVRDYRHAVRFQFDPDDSAGGFGSTGKGLILGIQDMLSMVFELSPNARLYMNRPTRRLLDQQMANNAEDIVKYVSVDGRPTATFQGVVMRDRVDALVAETAIS